MDKKILLGAEDFGKLIREGGYYVDKTEFLYDLLEKAQNQVTLFTRPRRFGKSLTLSMMENFFDVRRDSKDVFEGLDISSNHPEFCKIWMNQYPVLLLSLKDVEGLTFAGAFAKLKMLLADICKKYEFLQDIEGQNTADLDVFTRLMFQTATDTEVAGSLKMFMRMMHAAYGKPVILLIDEYDVALAKAHANGYYRQMLDVIRSLLSISLKTNEYLQFAVVTGCLRIPKESIFTGVNNFASYSVLDSRFSEYFGFTQTEVEALLTAFDVADKIGITREWYDGYLFGDSEIYCPWDVLYYVSDLIMKPNAQPKPYWENTSGNDAIKAFFSMENVDISEQFETLLNGGTIVENVTNSLTYEEAYESVGNLWSILLMTGYVTKAQRGDQSGTIELRIPNREIAAIFQKSVVDHFNRTVDQGSIRDLMQALWNGEEEKASDILSDLLWNTISFMDYHEDYYHAFIAGIFVGRGGYAVQSNKERGLGRPDIDLRDKKNRRAMILEAKKAESKDRMDYWCDKAIQQIIDQEYAKNMDGYRTVRCYGISFYEKTAKVKLLK